VMWHEVVYIVACVGVDPRIIESINCYFSD